MLGGTQLQALYRSIRAFYTRARTESRLETLTKNMIQKAPHQPPKLRARGAEARGLVAYVRDETAEKLRDDVPVEAAVKSAAVHLHGTCSNLARDAFCHASLAEHSRKFALLYQSLDGATAEPFWRVKPKLHQMQELCELSRHNPAANWTHRDEEFGGFMASLVRIRGGSATAKRVGHNCLVKFFARHLLPVL